MDDKIINEELQFLKQKLTVLVIGYDGYVDVWEHDFRLMNKFWNNRPRTVLADAELNPCYQNVEVFNAGKDAEWSKKAIDSLKTIDTEYVLLLLEDFFICDFVDNKKLKKVVELMDSDNIDFYQISIFNFFKSHYKGKIYKNNKKIKIIPSGKAYPINLQAAVWRKSFLEEMLGKENYNAWIFEMNHMNDVFNKDRISCLVDISNILNITHGIVQSKYLRSAAKKLNKLGCNITNQERVVFTVQEDFKYNLKKIMSSIVPKPFKPLAKKIGKFMGIDFVTDRIKK